MFPKPKHQYARVVEGRASALRARLRLPDSASLDPEELARTYDSLVLADLQTLANGHIAELEVLRRCSSQWSAVALRIGSGPWLITWNPWHAATRTKASLMEEICHIVLGHRPTAVLPDPLTGLPRRTYSASKEKEAYAVAAAALVPYAGLVVRLRQGESADGIAKAYGVSPALVNMRVNVTGARG